MLKTEAEARKCWCPFARMAWSANWSLDNPSVTSVNSGDADQMEEEASTRCIASECMAWRWRSKHSLMFADWRDDNDELQGEARERKNHDGDEPRGYCGLAGKPEVS